MGLGRDNSIKIDQMYVVCFTRSDSHLWLIKLINCYWIKLSISKSLLKGKMSMSAFGVVWFEGALDSLSNSTSNLGPPSRSQGGGGRDGERGVGRRGTLGTRLSQTGLKNTDQARVREPPSACLPILGCDNILVKSFLCMHNLKVIKNGKSLET